MSNKLKELRAKEGFTIIEVIIVLVIGAVIMLAVFLVVPQLQRTQRNSNRQNSARRVFTAAEQVNANTSSYPAVTATAATDGPAAIVAITGVVNAPNGAAYTWEPTIPALGTGASSPNLASNSMYYTVNTATCTNNNPVASAAGVNSGKVVVAVAVEGSTSTNTGWCVSN